MLRNKAVYCFEADTPMFCGNGRVESPATGPGEQCDVGLLPKGEVDECCADATCTLRPGKRCSPYNHPCCTADCQFAPATHVCRAANANECHRETHCDGETGACPAPPQPVADGTECLDYGECQAGVCRSFCEKATIRKRPCICANVTDSCYRCCRDEATGVCEPHARSDYQPFRLAQGTRCIHGSCDARGVCNKEAVDVVQHLLKILNDLDKNTFRELNELGIRERVAVSFLGRNLIGVIIILTLALWIPAAILVHYMVSCDHTVQL